MESQTTIVMSILKQMVIENSVDVSQINVNNPVRKHIVLAN